MQDVEKETTNVGGILQHQLTQLCVSLKIDESEVNAQVADFAVHPIANSVGSVAEEDDIVRTSPPIEEALGLLSDVHHLSHSLLLQLVGDFRNLKLAQDVTDVFKVYEGDLRAISQGLSGLSNTERDFVRQIAKTAEKALNVLDDVEEDASLALGRAYVNGENVERQLRELAGNMQRRRALSQSTIPVNLS